MPAETKAKSVLRKAPYDTHHSRSLATTSQVISTQISSRISTSHLPLGARWQFNEESQVPEQTASNDFVTQLSLYLKSKNNAYRSELEKMEDALTQAEKTKQNRKETIASLGQTVEALEGAVTAVRDATVFVSLPEP